MTDTAPVLTDAQREEFIRAMSKSQYQMEWSKRRQAIRARAIHEGMADGMFFVLATLYGPDVAGDIRQSAWLITNGRMIDEGMIR